jgi:protein TonB
MMNGRQLRQPVAAGLRLSQFILQPMYTDLEHDDRISPPTYKFLIALLFSAISHAVAMTLINPGDIPEPATAPLQLAILSMPAPKTGASTPAAIPDAQTPRATEQVPEPMPVTEPKPVRKRVRQPQPPRPHPQAKPAPPLPQTPPAASERITVATSSRLTAIPESVPSMTAPRKVEYLYNPSPDYPPRARRLGLEGEVLIRTRVLPNGEPDELVLAQSSGYALLDQAAMKAVRTWRFRPARNSDERIASWVEIPVHFRLEH